MNFHLKNYLNIIYQMSTGIVFTQIYFEHYVLCNKNCIGYYEGQDEKYNQAYLDKINCFRLQFGDYEVDVLLGEKSNYNNNKNQSDTVLIEKK